MTSRGFLYTLGAGARRSLVLLWTAVLLCSLLLQYVAIAAPAQVLAVHDDQFQLDGNAVDDPGAPPDDWANHPGADAFAFIHEPANATIFTTGGSKDDLDTSQWRWTDGSVPDKDDLLDGFAALYGNNMYFGADRYANNGDSAVGFWFFQNGLSRHGDGTFSPPHAVGDLFVVSHFENGGAASEIQLYQWVGSGGSDGALDLLGSGVVCTAPPIDDKACGIANASDTPAPWPYSPKAGTAGTFPQFSIYEGGLDLAQVFGGEPPCFSSFLVETRSSQEVNAQLKDFIAGDFNTCVPPDITTQASTSNADFGSAVTDTATLSGQDGPVTGSVKFFLCGPSGSYPDCSSGGTQVGGAVTISGGTATSAAYTVGTTAAAAGKYCFRAEYTPDAQSQYLAGSHTNKTTECFKVDPATIEIVKTANPAGPVNAGEDIGFDITVTNGGTTTTLGVSVSDPLPAGVDWTADAPTGSTTGLTCAITGAVGSETLACTKASLAAGQSFTVHIHGTTDAADCDQVSNTANVGTANDGSDSDDATVGVQCPDIKVTKTPDGSSINAGETATFSIKVENLGPGTATGVSLTDNLPAGVHWTESEADCSISGADGSQVLSCTVGTLASGASKTYSVSAATTKANCGTINNEATASATNEPSGKLANNTDTGSIDVLCADVQIVKTADAGTVNAGDDIGFTITVSNAGDGTAFDVSASDTLDPAFSWSIESQDGGWSLVGNELSYSAASLAPGASSSVHVVATTDAENCRAIPNTATVTSSNDGSGEASASVTVLCPDIHVDKSADNSPINAGDTASYTITVTNDGEGTAYDVTLTDTLPAGIAWTDDSADCDIAAGVLSCDFGDLAAGASASVTVSSETDAEDCGTLSNTASAAASNESEADAADNGDSAEIVVSCPDLHIDKSAANSPISAGDTASYTITVTNDGVGTAYDVTLTDTLPAGIAWTDDSDACDISAGVLSCDFGDLTPGASASVTVSGETDAADCGTLPNTATTAASNESAKDAEDDSDSADILVNCPDLHIDKSAANSPISAGDTASFTITVTNDGDGRAYDVTLTDTLPAGIAWVDDSDACDIAGGVLSCDFGTLDSGESASVTVSGETDANDCGTIPNTATTAASNESAADAEDNSDSAEIVVNCAAIVITKTADDPLVNAADQVGFVITVTNKGAGSAFGVTVSDDLPTDAGLAWSIDAASSDPGWTIDGGVLEFGPATLASGASVSVHIVSPTTPDTCGKVENSASVTTSNDGSDDDRSEIVVACPDVTILKFAETTPILAGQTAEFTIQVWNLGPGTAYDVEINDVLPAGDWTEDSEACDIVEGVLSCQVGDLTEEDTFSVTLSHRTTAEDCGTIPNEASVTASNEPDTNTGNNEDGAEIIVQCAAIDLVKTAGDAPDGDTLLLDEPGDVVFTYVVTNTGTAVLENIALVDDNATPDDTSDDVTIDCPETTLAAGESITCTATLPVGVGTRTNVAEVTGNTVLEPKGKVSDTDDAVVSVPEPEVTPTPVGSVEELTPPPTSTLDEGSSSPAGNGLTLLLLAIGGIVLAVGLTPAAARAQRRDRRR